MNCIRKWVWPTSSFHFWERGFVAATSRSTGANDEHVNTSQNALPFSHVAANLARIGKAVREFVK
jgi:hypothetical protein